MLTMAEERLSEDGRTKLLNLLEAGDLKGEVATAWATPRRPSENSPAIRTNRSLFAGLTSSALTWLTRRCRLRSAHSGARSSAGDPRSPRGIPVTSRMARERPGTTSSYGSRGSPSASPAQELQRQGVALRRQA